MHTPESVPVALELARVAQHHDGIEIAGGAGHAELRLGFPTEGLEAAVDHFVETCAKDAPRLAQYLTLDPVEIDAVGRPGCSRLPSDARAAQVAFLAEASPGLSAATQISHVARHVFGVDLDDLPPRWERPLWAAKAAAGGCPHSFVETEADLAWLVDQAFTYDEAARAEQTATWRRFFDGAIMTASGAWMVERRQEECTAHTPATTGRGVLGAVMPTGLFFSVRQLGNGGFWAGLYLALNVERSWNGGEAVLVGAGGRRHLLEMKPADDGTISVFLRGSDTLLGPIGAVASLAAAPDSVRLEMRRPNGGPGYTATYSAVGFTAAVREMGRRCLGFDGQNLWKNTWRTAD